MAVSITFCLVLLFRYNNNNNVRVYTSVSVCVRARLLFTQQFLPIGVCVFQPNIRIDENEPKAKSNTAIITTATTPTKKKLCTP